MEINHFEDVRGALATEDIYEGRMVLMINPSGFAGWGKDYGSNQDIPGVKVPTTAAEAGKARYVCAFSVDNAVPPIYQPYPTIDWSLRQGFDKAQNVPFTAKIRLTQPSVTEGDTIPSGYLALAFSRGVYTVASGQYVYTSDVETPGNYLGVAYSGADGGKLQYSATASFAEVVNFDRLTSRLQFRINY